MKKKKFYSKCEFNSKINVLCVENVDVCMCKFGICGSKRLTKKVPKKGEKKVPFDSNSSVCCLCVL